MTYRKTENFLACVNHSRTNSLFPNMVLVKTEHSNAVNVRYTFQLLMSFWYIIIVRIIFRKRKFKIITVW